jgi:PX domain
LQAYRIRVKTLRRGWTVERRFSDFIWLHDMLAEAMTSDELPQLPSRRIFGDKMNREFIEERRSACVLRGCRARACIFHTSTRLSAVGTCLIAVALGAVLPHCY